MVEVESTIRLLVADDSEETRASIRKLLSLETDIEVVGEACNGLEAIEKIRTLRPNVVLMDIRMPELDGYAATESVVAELSSVQVIMMSVSGTSEALRRAMLAGAREFLVKPFEPDELVASIRRVYELYTPEEVAPVQSEPVTSTPVAQKQEGKIIAVFGPTGGVGRTTIACNLAVALAGKNKQRQVALVDACMRFGDIGIMLGLRGEHSVGDLAHMEPSDIDSQMLSSVLTQHKSGVRVLLAPARPDNGEVVSPSALKHILEELRQTNEFVVVDVSPALNEIDLAVLEAADKVIVLFTLEMTSLKSVKLYLEMARAHGYSKDRVVMVANRVDEAGGVRLADVEANLGFQTTICIRNDAKVTTLALNKGVPFVQSHAHTSVAQSVEELAARLQNPDRAPEKAPDKDDKGKKAGGFQIVRPGKRQKEAAA